MKKDHSHNKIFHVMEFAFKFFVNQRPLAFSVTALVLHSFLLKYCSFELSVLSLKSFISHCKQGKAQSSIITKAVSPAYPNLMVLFRMAPSFSIWRDSAAWESNFANFQVLLLFVRGRKRLLCPVKSMLLFVYLFLKP